MASADRDLFGEPLREPPAERYEAEPVPHPQQAGRWTIAMRRPESSARDYVGVYESCGDAWQAIRRGDHRRPEVRNTETLTLSIFKQ